MAFQIVRRCLVVTALAATSPALAETAPGDCTGVDFDGHKPIVVSKVVAGAPKVFYVKSAWEDASCPADSETCRGKAYLVPGDLVLTGRTLGPYACIAYESRRSKRPVWINGWIKSDSLAAVAPSPASRPADWIGTWSHPGGDITIAPGKKGKLSIEGSHFHQAGENVRTGFISAEAKPVGGILAFAEDGSTPFETAKDDDCRVRMQRVGAMLVVEDNGGCGGSMVTFTGFYRRKR